MIEPLDRVEFEDDQAPFGRIRLAVPADNAALLDLFGDVPMRGSLILTTERAPSFTALYELQAAQTQCWVYELEGRLLGLGTIIWREGYIQGQPTKVAYLGDLRARKEVRGALARFYGKIFNSFSALTGCEHFYTGILASNAAALTALVARSAHREQQPRYELFRRFDAMQLQFTRRPRIRYRAELRVRTAQADDLPALSALLDADHRRRPFGYRYDCGELEARLARWPGFGLAGTYLCEDGAGRLLGCCTAWDADAVKRYRILEYRGNMRLVRLGFNLGAKVMGYTPLPPPGSCLRYFYLANLSVVDDDPQVLSALMSKVYQDFERAGYNFFMVYAEEGDPLRDAFNGFSTRALGFHLYSVHAPNSPGVDYGAGRAGFEIALA